MKRILTLGLCALLALGLLAGCGTAPLPEGMTEEQVQGLAAATVQLAASGDWAALPDTMSPEMLAAVEEMGGADGLAEAWASTIGETGAFVKIASTVTAGQNGLAVAVVKAEFAEKDVTFTLSYDTDEKLAGLFFK